MSSERSVSGPFDPLHTAPGSCARCGIGKDWAKGLTKETDPRIARAAAAHVGLHYTHHLAPERDRRSQTRARPVDTTWSPTLAYAVGLIATDGNLSPSGKSTNVVSAEIDLLETFKRCIPRAGRIGAHGPNAWRVTVSSVAFYRWLVTIGLMPKKSLILGAIDVPDAYLIELARGLMDGDGGIANFIHHPAGNIRRYPNYRYERLHVRFRSASRIHLEWLERSLERVLAISGPIFKTVPKDRPNPNPMYELRYGKHASLALLQRMYANPDSPRLERKWKIWEADVARPRINSLQKSRSGVTAASTASRAVGPKGP